MKNDNYCILTGIIRKKNRNADTKDMKRPVIDIEFVQEDMNDPFHFKLLPVVCADKQLVKLSQGFHEGDIITVVGALRTDNSELYIEAETISVSIPKEKGKFDIASQFELLQMPQRFNLVNIIGETTTNNEVISIRSEYIRGDLSTQDIIPIYYEKGSVPALKKAVCAGKLGIKDGKIYLFVSNVISVFP